MHRGLVDTQVTVPYLRWANLLVPRQASICSFEVLATGSSWCAWVARNTNSHLSIAASGSSSFLFFLLVFSSQVHTPASKQHLPHIYYSPNILTHWSNLLFTIYLNTLERCGYASPQTFLPCNRCRVSSSQVSLSLLKALTRLLSTVLPVILVSTLLPSTKQPTTATIHHDQVIVLWLYPAQTPSTPTHSWPSFGPCQDGENTAGRCWSMGHKRSAP